MKRISYYITLAGMLCFAACQKDVLEGGNAGDGLMLNFASGVEGLTDESLAKEVSGLHLLVFDENGNYVSREEFADIESVKPVKLTLGKYTFAYISNIDNGLIGGVKEGATIEDITLSLVEQDGKMLPAGNIFTGTDEVTVGEDKASDAVLRRAVGMMEINVNGVPREASLESVVLAGSPKQVRFSGEAVGECVSLDVPMSRDETGKYFGNVLAFPTAAETAALQVTIIEEGEKSVYDITLKNKVEANKIHTVNVKYNPLSVPKELAVETEYLSDWGAFLTDTIMAEEMFRVDTLTMKIVLDGGESVLQDVDEYDIKFSSPLGYQYDVFLHDFLDKNISGDTLELRWDARAYDGTYRIERGNLNLRKEGIVVYSLKEDLDNIEITRDGEVVIPLPGSSVVNANDLAVMKELRDAMALTNDSRSKQWALAGDNLSQWQEVELNAEGRVVGIGYPEWQNNDKDSFKVSRVAKTGSRVATRSNGTIILPESLKELTELRYFTVCSADAYPVSELPSYFKDFQHLEELSVTLASATIPELPVSLVYLDVDGENLTGIPAHIGNLTNLVYASFNDDMMDEENEGVYFNLSRIVNVEADFSKLTNLKELWLIASDECEMPSSFWQNSSVEDLFVGGFSKIDIPVSHGLKSLRSLMVGYSKAGDAGLEALKSCPLESLSLINVNGPYEWIGDLSSLVELDLCYCNIESIPASWDNLEKLEDLYIEHCNSLTGTLPEGLKAKYLDGSLYVSVYESPGFDADGVTLSVDMVDIQAPYEGGTYTVQVTSNAAWTVIKDGDLDMTINPMSGNGNATLTITINRNPEYWSKNGSIDICINDRNVVRVWVYQEPNP